MKNRIKRTIKSYLFRVLVRTKYFKQQREAKEYVLSFKPHNEHSAADREYLEVNSLETWKKVLLEYNKYKPKEVKTMMEHLGEKNVYLVKKSYGETIPQGEPILICNVKNDLERLKVLVEHHKKLGVKYFAFLDNMSTDGTFEWLQTQPFDLYRVEEQYNSVVRSMWIAKIASGYGLERWFITIDSDELLVYDDFENQKIQDVIHKFEKDGIDTGMGFMIDMYADSSNLKRSGNDRDIYETYNLFDIDSYCKKDGILGERIHGGPRERYFGKGALMTKYPLFFWRTGDLNRYHYIFSVSTRKKSKCCLGLLHYKFIDGDYDKIKKIVEEGNYASGSSLYKAYLNGINANGEISFCYEGTKKLTVSSDLLEIDILESVWDKKG